MLTTSLLIASLLTAEAPATTPADPNWNVGVGASFGNGALPSATLASSGTGISTSAFTLSIFPGASALVERRLSPDLWLSLGLGFSYANGSTGSTDNNVTPATTTSTGVGTTLLAVTGGVRYQLTHGAPVDVSVVSALTLAYGGLQFSTSSSAAGVVSSTSSALHGYGLGLQGGLAVERSITERVALRFTAYLLQAQYAGASGPAGLVGGGGTGTISLSYFNISASIVPWLEIRFYF